MQCLITKILKLWDIATPASKDTQAEEGEKGVHQSAILEEKHYPTPSQPIQISGQGHWRARKVSKEVTKLAFQHHMANGAHVPEIDEPHNTFRQNTRAPGTCRWNAITASWTDFDRGSSRGTWGFFKDQRRLIRQSSSDEVEGRGLSASKDVPTASTLSAKSEEGKWLLEEQPSLANQQRQSLHDTEERNQSGTASNVLTIEELRRLAAENEAAVESYRSSLDTLVIKNVVVGYGPSARP